MRLLIIANENYPTNRPILSELWNKEFTKRGHSIVWIMLSSKTATIVQKTNWGLNTVYLLPIIGRSPYIKIFSRMICFILMIYLLPYLVISKKIDVIHFHNAVSSGFIWSLYKPFFGIPSSFAYTFPFHLLNRDNGYFQLLRKDIYKTVLYFVLNRVSVIMPISVYFKEVLQKELGTSPDKYLPVSESASSFFLNYPTNVNQSVLLKKRFIYVGEMSKQRQLNTILDAFDVVFKKYYNIELVMIGWGISDRDVMNLKEYAAQLPSGGSIVFMEKINYEDIPKIVTTCIAGLSPIPPIDIYLISTPTKCIEYVSLGVPVIANREIYDQNEFVTQSEGGLLVNYSAIEFAEAMTYMIEHTEKVKTMGENGRKWLNQHRSFHLLSETIEDRYNSIIN